MSTNGSQKLDIADICEGVVGTGGVLDYLQEQSQDNQINDLLGTMRLIRSDLQEIKFHLRIMTEISAISADTE